MMRKQLFVGETRILRPYEFQQILSVIPKNHLRNKFESLLYSGMKYIDLQKLHSNPDYWFDSNAIHIPLTDETKSIRLNEKGIGALTQYLTCNSPLPFFTGWHKNLKRWAEKAGLDPQGIFLKTTRKTWETWLVICYPDKFKEIFKNQGYNRPKTLDYCKNLDFSAGDYEQMKTFTEGWTK